MAQLLQGKNLLLFFRERALKAQEDGAKLRFQTEHSISKSKETESTSTKDGMINSINDGEVSIEVSSLAYIDDKETIVTWRKLEDCFDRNALMEIWEVDITEATPENPKIKATYYQGYFTDFEISAPADGNVELSYSIAVNGKGVKGEDTLTTEQLEAVKNAIYDYETIKKVSEEDLQA